MAKGYAEASGQSFKGKLIWPRPALVGWRSRAAQQIVKTTLLDMKGVASDLHLLQNDFCSGASDAHSGWRFNINELAA